MANWNLPTATSGYLDFVTEMNTKFVDAATLQLGSPINLPESAIRYNRSINLFQEWVAGNWINKILSIAGGGTGSSTPAGIITNLGLGSMSTQNSNAVNITGGSITGVNFDANNITGGIVALARGGTGVSLSISGLGAILISNGSQIIWDNGQNIASLNATALAVGTVPAARLPVNVPLTDGNNTWNGQNTFNGYAVFAGAAGSQSPTVVSVSPRINFYESDAGVDQHYKIINIDGGNFYFQAINDIYSNVLATYASLSSAGMVLGAAGENILYAKGDGITNINGSNIATGTINPNRLGASPDSTKFLRGDGVWAVPAGGSSGTPIPAGLIAMFDTSCPAGWTRYSQMDGRFPIGANSVGGTGGGTNHSHSLSGGTDLQGGHTHSVDVAGNANGSINGNTAGPDHTVQINYDAGTSTLTFARDHFHAFSAPVSMPISASGNTNNSGAHNHSLSGGTSVSDHMPPYYNIVFCRKD